MKKISKFLFLTLFAMIVAFVSCTKENDDVRLDPKLSTSEVYNVTSDSATVVGFVVAGNDGITERGICYNTTEHPTPAENKVVYTGTTSKATFTVMLGGLHYATTYFARAYVINATGTLYGEEYTFTTLPVVPTLTTVTITSITGNSGNGGGNVTVTGGADVTARGVVFGENPNPTLTDNKTADGDGAGEFTSALTGLKGNTKYYVRAYATNSAGTGYGPQVEFTTLVDLPAVTTAQATEVTKTSAKTGGEVTYDGGGTVSSRGIVWSLNPNPTLFDHVITSGNGLGSFNCSITELDKSTTYHIRAYATNSAGTAYGEDVQFKTLDDILTWYIPGDYVEASYPGSGLTNWSPGNSPKVMSSVTASDKLEGYVYMANGNNNWKFATQPNWDGPNYGGTVAAGILDPSGDNYQVPAGFYKLNADATAMTFTAVATNWGVIGDATPGGWGDETALTYVPETKLWSGGLHLTAASFKFRANHDWGFNYGSTDHVNLVSGGDNIPVAVEADYFFKLDLSHPLVYTYSAHRWGLIGSATPDGWNSDQNMTWDGTALTITLDLVAGEVKFRADDDWGLNYGGDLNALSEGGANIPIATAGNYTIKLYLSGITPYCTITKN